MHNKILNIDVHFFNKFKSQKVVNVNIVACVHPYVGLWCKNEDFHLQVYLHLIPYDGCEIIPLSDLGLTTTTLTVQTQRTGQLGTSKPTCKTRTECF